MLVLSVLSNLPKGQVELKVGQGKQKTHLPTGQVDLDSFFLPWEGEQVWDILELFRARKYISNSHNSAILKMAAKSGHTPNVSAI